MFDLSCLGLPRDSSGARVPKLRGWNFPNLYFLDVFEHEDDGHITVLKIAQFAQEGRRSRTPARSTCPTPSSPPTPGTGVG